MNAPHPYLLDELAAGRALAGQFLERLARMGSLTRMAGFASRVQEVLQTLYTECVPAGADPRGALYPIGGRDDVVL